MKSKGCLPGLRQLRVLWTIQLIPTLTARSKKAYNLKQGPALGPIVVFIYRVAFLDRTNQNPTSANVLKVVTPSEPVHLQSLVTDQVLRYAY